MHQFQERAAREEEDRLADERRALDFFASLDADSNGDVTKEEMMANAVFDQNLVREIQT